MLPRDDNVASPFFFTVFLEKRDFFALGAGDEAPGELSEGPLNRSLNEDPLTGNFRKADGLLEEGCGCEHTRRAVIRDKQLPKYNYRFEPN